MAVTAGKIDEYSKYETGDKEEFIVRMHKHVERVVPFEGFSFHICVPNFIERAAARLVKPFKTLSSLSIIADVLLG